MRSRGASRARPGHPKHEALGGVAVDGEVCRGRQSSTIYLLARYAQGMEETNSQPGIPDVPQQVFEQFLADLAEKGQPAELVARLRKALIEEASFSERALRAAVLPDEPTT